MRVECLQFSAKGQHSFYCNRIMVKVHRFWGSHGEDKLRLVYRQTERWVHRDGYPEMGTQKDGYTEMGTQRCARQTFCCIICCGYIHFHGRVIYRPSIHHSLRHKETNANSTCQYPSDVTTVLMAHVRTTCTLVMFRVLLMLYNIVHVMTVADVMCRTHSVQYLTHQLRWEN